MRPSYFFLADATPFGENGQSQPIEWMEKAERGA
jgi:hypothetical protein